MAVEPRGSIVVADVSPEGRKKVSQPPIDPKKVAILDQAEAYARDHLTSIVRIYRKSRGMDGALMAKSHLCIHLEHVGYVGILEILIQAIDQLANVEVETDDEPT